MSCPEDVSTKCTGGTVTSSSAVCCESGRLEMARGMVDNFFFEVENYGAMLNANRTYYLTRSQPPFMSSMVVDVYQAMQKEEWPSRCEDGSGLARSRLYRSRERLWDVDQRTASRRRYRPLALLRFRQKVRRRRLCRMKPGRIARSQNISSFIPRTRTATLSLWSRRRKCGGRPSIFDAGLRCFPQHVASGLRQANSVQTERGLLQRRSLHAGVRIRRELPLRTIWSSYASLRACLLEQSSLQDGERSAADQLVARAWRGRQKMERAG